MGKARHWAVLAATAALALGFSTGAEAYYANNGGTTSVTWDFCGNNFGCGNHYGGAYTGSVQDHTFSATSGSGPNATVHGYSDTGTGGALQSADAYQYGTNGIGVVNNNGESPYSYPDHSMDNHINTDSLLFSFDQAVQLTGVELGWTYNDSDITVLAYTGMGAPPSLTGGGYNALTSNGWQLVGNYNNIGTAPTTINSGNVVSSYWLVGAANSTFGGTAGLSDYVKLCSLAGVVPQGPPPPNTVPAPATLTLVGLGLGLLVRRRHREGRAA
jgi:uncharacterized protein (TIGR03382 family)